MNINGIIYYLKCQYSPDKRDQITFIQDILSQGDVPESYLKSYLKAISKS